MFTPSTSILASSGYRSSTLRGFLGSLSSPVITTTLSPFLMLNFGLNRLLIYIALSLLFFLSIRPPYAAPPHPAGRPGPRGAVNYLQNFRRQGDDLHISLVTQFPGHWPENTGSAGLVGCVQQYHSVIVEADIRAILPAQFLPGADNDRLGHRAFLNTTRRQCILYGDYDLIADASIILPAIPQHADTQHFLGPA